MIDGLIDLAQNNQYNLFNSSILQYRYTPTDKSIMNTASQYQIESGETASGQQNHSFEKPVLKKHSKKGSSKIKNHSEEEVRKLREALSEAVQENQVLRFRVMELQATLVVMQQKLEALDDPKSKQCVRLSADNQTKSVTTLTRPRSC